MLAESLDAPGVHKPAVHLPERHRRRNPRMLRKKLEKIVWTPSAVSVTPGMTQRIVWL
jgi:hypothetical protein